MINYPVVHHDIRYTYNLLHIHSVLLFRMFAH